MNGQSSEGNALTAITVKGFKSLSDETRVEVRPLTILAGANSSGKSSIMQPLLLLKQTLEAPYDPGPLLLDGPNVAVTEVDQFWTRLSPKKLAHSLEIRLDIYGTVWLQDVFERSETSGISLTRMSLQTGKGPIHLRPSMTSAEIIAEIGSYIGDTGGNWTIERERSFFTCRRVEDEKRAFAYIFNATRGFEAMLLRLIHVPVHRAAMERRFPIAAVRSAFPGRFENYVASVVLDWQTRRDARLESLASSTNLLGLTTSVQAKRINDAQVELFVNRLPADSKRAPDLVNVADVGSGVSQTLPVLVALLAAEPGQLVYLEEPEMNLHPRAQWKLAEVLADAAKRGVRVVAETHSSLLLLGIEELVAEGKLAPELVKLHWFSRDQRGATKVTPGELDEAGAFGDWPEDFADVELDAQNRFLNAAETVLERQSLAGNGQ